MFTLTILAAFAAPLPYGDDTFHVGEERVSMAELVRSGTVLGRTGRVLVRADNASKISGLAEVRSVRTLAGGLLSVTPTDGDLALARQLHARPDVAWALPDLILAVKTRTDDPFAGDQWHLENTGQGGRTVDVDIDAEAAWTAATGAGVTIAVLDSGVQLDHPDLSVIAGHDYVGGDDDPSPDFADGAGPHGTGVAGIAAATGDNGYGVAGVAWAADVYAIRLIGGAGSSLEALYEAFAEAADAGAAVLSNSWGFDNCSGVPSYRVFDEMFDYAEQNGRGGLGTVVVFAAGNGGCDVDGDGMLQHPTAVVVAALESDDVRASYSAWGDVVDIAAPTGLLTTDLVGGGYGSYGGDDAFYDGFSGTSGATPVVSGVVALMVEANPRIRAQDIRDALCATAVRNDTANAGYDAAGRSPWYGCGRVDAGAAVAAVADVEPLAPVPVLVADTTLEGRAILAWEAAVDPDGDVLGYEVEWSGGAIAVSGLSVDIGEDVGVGDVVEWRVRAVDPWGPGPFSETVTFTVVRPEVAETPGGCAHVTGMSVTGMSAIGILLAGLMRRRPA